MNNYWEDRVAIITGATHGIGLRLAERLAEKGVNISTIYKNNDQQAVELRDRINTDFSDTNRQAHEQRRSHRSDFVFFI